jgi:hypothetical protein
VNAFFKEVCSPKTNRVLTAKNGVLGSKPCFGRAQRGFNWRALGLIFRGGVARGGGKREKPAGVRGLGLIHHHHHHHQDAL